MFSFFRAFIVVGLLFSLSAAGYLYGADDAAADEDSTLYYSANALYNRKLHALAIGEYKLFLQKHPGHSKVGDANYGLALSYYALGRFKEAEPELRAVIQLGKAGDSARLHLMLGQSLLKQAKVADAEKVFSDAEKLVGETELKPMALAGLSEALFAQSKWESATDAAERLLKLEPQPALLIRALYQAGYSRHQLKQYKEALPLFEKLLGKAEGALKQQTAFLLAECARETGDLDKAALHYPAAVELKGVEHEVYYRMGVVQFALGHYDDAIVAFSKSLEIKPDSNFAASAAIYSARSWLEKGKYDKVIELLQPLAQGDTAGVSDEAAIWLARAFTVQKQYAKASELLGAAIKKFPKSRFLRELRFDNANALMASGDNKGAAALLAGMLNDTKWGQYADVLRLYAVTLHKTGDYAGSLNYATKFMQLSKDDAHSGDILFL